MSPGVEYAVTVLGVGGTFTWFDTGPEELLFSAQRSASMRHRFTAVVGATSMAVGLMIGIVFIILLLPDPATE